MTEKFKLEMANTLLEVENTIKEVTTPVKKVDMDVFLNDAGAALALAILRNKSIFSFSKTHGLEIHNPNKAKIIQ